MRLFRAAGKGVLLVALVTGIAGCVPSAMTHEPVDVAAEQAAANQATQGHFDQAAQAYLNLANQSRDGSHYLLLAAEAYRQEGTLERATPLLAAIKRSSLSGDEPVRYDLLGAELALAGHDAPHALQLTTQPNVSVPPALQLRLLELRAQAMAASGDAWGAARSRAEMDVQLVGLDQAQNRRQALESLAKLGPAALQQRAAAMQPGERMLPWINEALARLGVAVARPQPLLDQPVGTVLPDAANVREGFKMPEHIALLLPAGRSFGAASNAVREGFFAAWADSARNHAPRAAVRVYDSGGNAASAAKAYLQAMSDGAQLVIGPLTRNEVAGVVALPQLGTPLLTLNHPDDKALPANGASEFGLLPETEGAQVADHMIERGLRSAYVVVSTDDFAQRAASAFKAELASRGGRVAGMTSLSSGQVNYASAIDGLNAASAMDAGIFISMRPQQARMLVPQLQVAHVALPVFGTSHIYAGVDDATSNGDLDGVEFCDAPWLFDAQPGLPPHEDIAAQLPAARGALARLFAFGMDAWNLAPYLDWLREHPGSYVPGASGQLTADQFGRVRRVLVWAKFQDGLAHPLGGSLQMDDVPATAPPTDDNGQSAPLIPANDEPAASPGSATSTSHSAPANVSPPAAAASSGLR